MQMVLKHLALQFTQDESSFSLTEHSKPESSKQKCTLLDLNFCIYFLSLSRHLARFQHDDEHHNSLTVEAGSH